MIRHFMSGPKGYGWKGRCLVDTDTGLYIHYPEWPEISIEDLYIQEFQSTTLDKLIGKGVWLEIPLDPDLMLDEDL